MPKLERLLSYSQHTSETLWRLFLLGDHKALDLIVKKHYNLLYQYGCRFTRDRALVKDCIQDLFLYLWQKRSSISETPAVDHYLMKALRRRLERALSRKTFEFIDQEPAVEDHRVSQEQHAALASIIKQLSKRQQEIIYLRFYLNADAARIADIMQLNRQSVYNLLHEAINQLRKLTEQHFKKVPLILLLLDGGMGGCL